MGPNVTAPVTRTSETNSHSWGTRTGAGVIFYLKSSLFGCADSGVYGSVGNTLHPKVAAAAEDIADTTLAAVERGAKGLTLDLSARLSFRAHFIPRILMALEDPDWRSAWARERRYVLAYAEAMGLRAAIWAGRDGRRCITADDIEEAATRLRGYMPVAGRWCPS